MLRGEGSGEEAPRQSSLEARSGQREKRAACSVQRRVGAPAQ